MAYLVELTKAASEDKKEAQGIYTFDTDLDAKGEYEFKLGQAMKSEAYSAFCYVLISNNGAVAESKFDATEDELISPRLISVTRAGDTEATDIAKYSTFREVQANFHSKYGATIKDATKTGILLLEINENGSPCDRINWVRP